MMRRRDEWMVKTGLLGIMIGAIVVGATGKASADEFWFRVQVSYLSGFSDLVDQYKDNIDADVSWSVPVGISLFPHYQWDNGLQLGVGIGPAMIIMGDATHWEVPLSLTLGYTLFPDKAISPYIRVGPSYHVAGGDFYDSSDLGVVAAVGVEFLQNEHFRFGVEGAYDSATTNIKTRNGPFGGVEGTRGIKTAEFSIGLFFQFG